MRRLQVLALAAILVAAGAGRASADILLEGVHWQVGHVQVGRAVTWEDLKVLEDGPPKLDNRLRARLVIKNDGAKDEDGLLLRFSLTARVAPAAGAVSDGTWAVPFIVDEKRVPKLAAGKTIDAPLDSGAALDLYMRRLARAGWWPDRIKVQAMLEPRPGTKSVQMVEDILEVKREKTP